MLYNVFRGCLFIAFSSALYFFSQRKPEGTVLAPVIDLKSRKGDIPSEIRFNQITGKVRTQFVVVFFCILMFL